MTLAAAWTIAWAAGEDVAMPYGELVVSTLLKTPALLLFPLALWLTGFFVPGERRRLTQVRDRLLGRGAAPAAGTAAGALGASGSGAVTSLESADAAGAAPVDAGESRAEAPGEGILAEDVELSADELLIEEEDLEVTQETDMDGDPAEGGSSSL